jgi:drug/metabolite transporter (DMT)-like permease
MTAAQQRNTPVLAALALVLNAFVWGVSWWPFRFLEQHGLHPLWATALIYAFAMACLLAWRPAAGRALLRHRSLWLLALAAGLTNACFNWGVTEGDVVRVVLLFYLLPVWTTLLAWPILGERPSAMALLRMALALTGVVTVLKSPGGGWPLPQSLPDWLGLAGGLCFSITNILLLRLRDTPDNARTLSMFVGGGVIAALVASAGMMTGVVNGPPAPALSWVLIAVLLSLGFLIGNTALQYGAARLSANSTALVMLSEVVFASGSSIALGAADVSLRVVVGAALVVGAAAWSAASGAKAE